MDIYSPFCNQPAGYFSSKICLDQQAHTSPFHLPSSSLNNFISTTSIKKVVLFRGYRLFWGAKLSVCILLQHTAQDSMCMGFLIDSPGRTLSNSSGAVPVIQITDESCQPVLALAVRGLHAHSVLKDLTSSTDPLLLLLRKTELNPLHCRGQEHPLLCSPRLASQVHTELRTPVN
ncbi:hypothetical protein ABVT39_015432 [Epinephelus coioides]